MVINISNGVVFEVNKKIFIHIIVIIVTILLVVFSTFLVFNYNTCYFSWVHVNILIHLTGFSTVTILLLPLVL